MKKQLQIHDDCQIYNFAVGLTTTQLCKVFMEGKNLTILFMEDEVTSWHLIERTMGHYDCKMRGYLPGDITLHRFPDGLYLEGTLKYGEDNRTGMWRIDLKHLPKMIEVGSTILLKDGKKWVKQKVTAFKKDIISTKEFNDVTVADVGETWKFSALS
ncbi:MAG: hypothetical protein Q7R35_03510 [Elusimicrobiota bacterium]|nr:hypothetical protein [Elusimicrobiota bacterium]